MECTVCGFHITNMSKVSFVSACVTTVRPQRWPPTSGCLMVFSSRSLFICAPRIYSRGLQPTGAAVVFSSALLHIWNSCTHVHTWELLHLVDLASYQQWTENGDQAVGSQPLIIYLSSFSNGERLQWSKCLQLTVEAKKKRKKKKAFTGVPGANQSLWQSV